jgi:hypothetical protein
MALETIESGSPPQGRDLSQALVELQNLTFSVVSGAAADTNIALTGYTHGTDTIKSVLRLIGAPTDITDISDLTSEVQAPSPTAEAFQLSTTATTGSKLLVIWFNKGAL